MSDNNSGQVLVIDSDDSSYDSDNDNSKQTSVDNTTSDGIKRVAIENQPSLRDEVGSSLIASTNSKKPLCQTSSNHSNVSRQFSDTLASELTDNDSSYHQDEVENVAAELLSMKNPEYRCKVEFAVRLGYSESALQKVILKVGFTAQQNQILEELVKLRNEGAEWCEDGRQKSNKFESSSGIVEICESSQIDDQREKSEDGVMKFATYRLEKCKLLPIVIDGSNVAMGHGNKQHFSCKGIKLCVDWFRTRGHTDITVFVPKWRKETSKPDAPCRDQSILIELEGEGVLNFTPSRQVSGKRYVCHDDRYILNLAAITNGVVVSNDNYRELIKVKPEFKKVIEEKILMFSFIGDRFMPPDDPLGRNGPTLDQFLRVKQTPFPINHNQPCPYAKKCTYGNKCKFFHANRSTTSVSEKMRERSILKLQQLNLKCANVDRENREGECRDEPSYQSCLIRTQSMLPLNERCEDIETCEYLNNKEEESCKQQLGRTRSYQYNKNVVTRPRSPINKTGNELFISKDDFDSTLLQNKNVVKCRSNLERTRSNTPPKMSRQMTTFTAARNSHHFTSPPPSLIMPNVKQHRPLSRQLTLDPSRPFQQLMNVPPPSTYSIPFPPPNIVRGDEDMRDYLHNPDNRDVRHSQLDTTQHSLVSRNVSAPESNFPIRHTTEQLTPPIQQSSGESSHFKWIGAPTSAVNVVRPMTRTVNENITQSVSIQQSSASFIESRSKIYFHLASIFPEEQVRSAMASLPHEVDAQNICKYIISLTEKDLNK